MILLMIFTGVDGEKSYSIDYNPLRKSWKPVKKSGRKVFVIPADKLLVKFGTSPIKDKYTLKRSLSLEIEEKFGDVYWDVSVDKQGNYTLVLYKDFEEPQDAYALDAEPFSLLRTALAHGQEDVFLLDIGKRKSILLNVEKGKLSSYRVVLRGGDFINMHIADKLGISEEEAERLKRSRGLKEQVIKESFEEIMNSFGVNLKGKAVMLCGGGSRLMGIEEQFERVIRCTLCEPEYASAFGASLSPVYRLNCPDFRQEEVSPELLRKSAVALVLSILTFLGADTYLDKLANDIRRDFKRAQVREFKKHFPNKPAVAVYDQVRSMYRGVQNPYSLTRKIEKLLNILRGKEISLYKIEYDGKKLTLKGEAKKEVVDSLPVKDIRKTPEGSFEFKIEI